MNRGAILHKCDVWVANDWIGQGPQGDKGGILHWSKGVQGQPDIVTGQSALDSLKRRGFAWPQSITTIESWWENWSPHTLSWTLYSSPTAMVYAAHLGAKRITIYGMDLAGLKDIDGVNPSLTRSDDLWNRQRIIYERTRDYLADKGVEVERVTLEKNQDGNE